MTNILVCKFYIHMNSYIALTNWAGSRHRLSRNMLVPGKISVVYSFINIHNVSCTFSKPGIQSP